MLESLNTQGSKGTNASWQRSVIELLKQISIGVGGTVPGGNLTPNVQRTSSSGSIAAGTKSVSFFNDGAVNGTVKGVVLKPTQIITFESDQGISAISYDATGTEFLITTLS